MKKVLIFSLLLVTALGARAQERLSMFTIDVGYASVHDSYLTPITYGGLDLGLAYQALRDVRAGQWLW